MESLVITVLMFLTLTVGANAQENQKVFTAEEQAMENGRWQLSTLAFTKTLGE